MSGKSPKGGQSWQYRPGILFNEWTGRFGPARSLACRSVRPHFLLPATHSFTCFAPLGHRQDAVMIGIGAIEPLQRPRPHLLEGDEALGAEHSGAVHAAAARPVWTFQAFGAPRRRAHAHSRATL